MTLALLLALVLAAPAGTSPAPAPPPRAPGAPFAQVRPAPTPPAPRHPGDLGSATSPFLIAIPSAGEPEVLSQHPLPGLDIGTINRLETVRVLRDAGELAAALDSARSVLAVAPHHPLVLSVLARVLEARLDWAGIVRLAQSERAATHDTLLLSHSLSQALERQRHPREAADVAILSWSVEPAEADWAFETVRRLAPADSRGIRDAMRRAAAARPDRVDLQGAAARLDWKLGDEAGALRGLLAADRPGMTPPLRWRFAEDLLSTGSERDSAGAIDALQSMAADTRFDASLRMRAARRAYDVHRARGTTRAGAPAIEHALHDLPPPRWNADLLLDVARGLRDAGQTEAARRLLNSPELGATAPAPLRLERALNDLRDGPPAASLTALHDIAGESDEARFHYAEALFFSGNSDSALAEYKRVSERPDAPFTGAALERIFLIEDAKPKEALPEVGRLMYLDWLGDASATLALADSLYRVLPHGALWSQVALMLSDRLDAAGQFQAALVPLLAVADDQPDDRLAPVARERAGDLYQFRLKQDSEAMAQYEACLTRYPKAWNSPEVRRRLEALRKRRF